MDIEKEMFNKAVDFMNYRYGLDKAGGVAVLRIENGDYLISVWDEEKKRKCLFVCGNRSNM